MENPFEKIIQFLKINSIHFNMINHQPVYTSQQAATIRGMSLHTGMKSLLIKANTNFVLLIIPGDKKLDSKKTRTLLQTKKIRFALPEEVIQIMGCSVGACYPFGNLINIHMYVDNSFKDTTEVFFNPGLHDKSIKIQWEDYKKCVHPHLVNIIQ